MGSHQAGVMNYHQKLIYVDGLDAYVVSELSICPEFPETGDEVIIQFTSGDPDQLRCKLSGDKPIEIAWLHGGKVLRILKCTALSTENQGGTQFKFTGFVCETPSLSVIAMSLG